VQIAGSCSLSSCKVNGGKSGTLLISLGFRQIQLLGFGLAFTAQQQASLPGGIPSSGEALVAKTPLRSVAVLVVGMGVLAGGGCRTRAEKTVMLTLLKIGAAAGIALGILNPGFSPHAEDCECKAKADGAFHRVVPRADDCECKAEANSGGRFLPHAEDCECKADA
jgi:hypothetical protein